MAITSGSAANASDFISTSAGAGSVGQVAKLNSVGQIDPTFILNAFGGTGADGALSISSGTTTINLGNAAVVVKNYTSISITGTGSLAFSNPNTNGTIVVLKSQGNVTITSSTNPAVDLRSMGAVSSASGNGLVSGPSSPYYQSILIVGGSASPGISIIGRGVNNAATARGKCVNAFAGAGGSPGIGGGGNNGAGGVGGGGLYVECGGSLNVTSTLNAAGSAGVNAGANGGSNLAVGGSGGAGNVDGVLGTAQAATIASVPGGGGGGGSICILYNSLTANTGTYTVTAGAAGTGGTASAGAGGAGWSLVAQNTEFQ